MYLEDVEADGATGNINIGVITRCLELDDRCNVGVIWWESNRDFEGQSGVNLEARE